MQMNPITREEITEGFGPGTPCAMYGTRHRLFPHVCHMWEELHDRVGCIGFRAAKDGEFAGQIIFLPKPAARRICLPICPTREQEATTLVIACLFVEAEARRQGVATALVRAVMDFARAHGYHRIEANVSLDLPGDKEFERISYLPFRSAGFLIDDTSIIHGNDAGPYYAGNRMCYCSVG